MSQTSHVYYSSDAFTIFSVCFFPTANRFFNVSHTDIAFSAILCPVVRHSCFIWFSSLSHSSFNSIAQALETTSQYLKINLPFQQNNLHVKSTTHTALFHARTHTHIHICTVCAKLWLKDGRKVSHWNLGSVSWLTGKNVKLARATLHSDAGEN